MYVWINSYHYCTIGTSARPNLAPTCFATAVRTFALGDIPKENTFHISSSKWWRQTVWFHVHVCRYRRSSGHLRLYL